MTTEDDFQAALDKDPNDWQTRLVFADWLQDRGDPRADGYRALGMIRARPWEPNGLGSNRWWFWGYTKNGRGDGEYGSDCGLPHDWQLLYVSTLDPDKLLRSNADKRDIPRREAEDVAAMVFFQLPGVRRQKLLSGVLTDDERQ